MPSQAEAVRVSLQIVSKQVSEVKRGNIVVKRRDGDEILILLAGSPELQRLRGGADDEAVRLPPSGSYRLNRPAVFTK